MLELLAPAGSPEAVIAAVQNGAGAVYLGYGDFNARRKAKNFSQEELAAAISYCHLRDVKVFLTLNTLLTDRELPQCAQVAQLICDLGVDAVLVQDLGVARMLRQVAPQLPLHGSTQMTVHSLDGVRQCAQLGLSRVVLSRELSRHAIAHICAHSPIEIEVFVHGALCMCYSGQCFFSSVIGGRSGNRGLCAQPCRLQYGWGDRADGSPLSLKDMSLSQELSALTKMGVTCVKIEGRMKRPEYVGVVTGIYARAIRTGTLPSPQEMDQLAAAFSRDGFTDGYFQEKTGPAMFGVREPGREPKELFTEAKAHYQRENPLVPVTLYALLEADAPAQVGVQDAAGHLVTAAGPVPEVARNRPLTAQAVEEQLSKTGGTPYFAQEIKSVVADGISLPLAVLNSLRREVLDGLSAQRSLPPVRETHPYQPGVRYENPKEPMVFHFALRTAAQLTPELFRLPHGLIYLPAGEFSAHRDTVAHAIAHGATLAVALPTICWDKEREALAAQLTLAKELGVTHALVPSWDLLPLAREMGFTLHGDYGLGVYNSQTVKELRRLDFASGTASFELKLAQIRDLSKGVPLEAIVYGRLPLMITENCIIKNRKGQCACENTNRLVDRKGAYFPVVKAPGCRSQILNSQKLFLADKPALHQSGLWAGRLLFTTENPLECVQVAQRYLNLGNWSPNEYTRGLYFRDVE